MILAVILTPTTSEVKHCCCSGIDTLCLCSQQGHPPDMQENQSATWLRQSLNRGLSTRRSSCCIAESLHTSRHLLSQLANRLSFVLQPSRKAIYEHNCCSTEFAVSLTAMQRVLSELLTSDNNSLPHPDWHMLVLIMQVLHRCILPRFNSMSVSSWFSTSAVVTENSTRVATQLLQDDYACCTVFRYLYMYILHICNTSMVPLYDWLLMYLHVV